MGQVACIAARRNGIPCRVTVENRHGSQVLLLGRAGHDVGQRPARQQQQAVVAVVGDVAVVRVVGLERRERAAPFGGGLEEQQHVGAGGAGPGEHGGVVVVQEQHIAEAMRSGTLAGAAWALGGGCGGRRRRWSAKRHDDGRSVQRDRDDGGRGQRPLPAPCEPRRGEQPDREVLDAEIDGEVGEPGFGGPDGEHAGRGGAEHEAGGHPSQERAHGSG